MEQKWSKVREVETTSSAQGRKTGVHGRESCYLGKQEKSKPCAQRRKIGAHRRTDIYVEKIKKKKTYFLGSLLGF